jgi:hypothetical protein
MSASHSHPLKEAAALLGGLDPLSRYLLVSSGDLDAWVQGRADPPHHIVGEAIYLVQELTRRR